MFYCFLPTTSQSMLRIARSPCRGALGSPCRVSGFAREVVQRSHSPVRTGRTAFSYVSSLSFFLSVGKKQNGRKISRFFRFSRENCKKSRSIFVKMTDIVILSFLNALPEHDKMKAAEFLFRRYFFMGRFPKDFLWGGATAANQGEGD